MKRARIQISPELLWRALGLPSDINLIGPANSDGNFEITIEHDDLPDVDVPEGASAPLVDVEITVDERGRPSFLRWAP